MVTGQKPIKKSKQGRFQILDVVGMMKPLTKFTLRNLVIRRPQGTSPVASRSFCSGAGIPLP